MELLGIQSKSLPELPSSELKMAAVKELKSWGPEKFTDSKR
jgi:hypothetical protein